MSPSLRLRFSLFPCTTAVVIAACGPSTAVQDTDDPTSSSGEEGPGEASGAAASTGGSEASGGPGGTGGTSGTATGTTGGSTTGMDTGGDEGDVRLDVPPVRPPGWCVDLAAAEGGVAPPALAHLHFFLGQPTGTWPVAAMLEIPYPIDGVSAMAVDDLDGDLRPDVALLQGASLVVGFGDGNTVSIFAAAPLQCAGSCRLATGDIDGDGVAEAVVVDFDGRGDLVRALGQVLETTPLDLAMPSGTQVAALAVADLDGSGRDDVAVRVVGDRDGDNQPAIVAVIDDRPVVIALDGNDGFCAEGAPMAAGDGNGDAPRDLFVLGKNMDLFAGAWLGTQGGDPVRGPLAAIRDECRVGHSALELADLDADGNEDLFTVAQTFDVSGCAPSPAIYWIPGNGDGSFAADAGGYLAGWLHPVVIDADRDGVLDVVTVAPVDTPNGTIETLAVTPGPLPIGTWALLAQLADPVVGQLVTLGHGDFDGDGWQDVVGLSRY